MQLKLMMNGEMKEFTPLFVGGRHLRTLMQFDNEIDYENIGIEETDKLAEFVCEVFGNQFTVDEFLDGTPSYELINTIGDVFSLVRVGEVPKQDNGQSAGETSEADK